MERSVETAVVRRHARDRWSESEARAVLAELESSGESVTNFSQRMGVKAERIVYWKRRMSAPAAKRTPAPAFVPVRLPPALPVSVAAPSEPIEITVSGVTIHVRADVDVERLAQIAVAIARRARGC